MSKILTDKELGQIIYQATHYPEVIEDCDSYTHFLEDLGELIAKHFGGERGGVDHSSVSDEWLIAFSQNEMVPADGGIFKDYDTAESWGQD